MNKQKAYDAKTGIDRELTTNEKLLVQNDNHLQSHITLQEKLEEIQKRLDELTDRVQDLETSSNAMYWTIYNDETEEIKTMDPNTNIEETNVKN